MAYKMAKRIRDQSIIHKQNHDKPKLPTSIQKTTNNNILATDCT